jgi:hypothetical protein
VGQEAAEGTWLFVACPYVPEAAKHAVKKRLGKLGKGDRGRGGCAGLTYSRQLQRRLQ